jgi:type IV pilus assembly protein PilB
VDTGTIKIDFYDNGQVDGDTISVYVNNMPVVSNQRLTTKPVSIKVKIDLKRTEQEVIMVGEIRDDETAEMAFRAAQTGHLLLSTLHTNTAIETIPRLLDLNIDPNTLASSLIGVMGQRLVRKVCSKCTAAYRPSDDLMREFFGGPPTLTLHKGRGCNECHFTGYRGRVSIVELWVPSEEDILLISKRAPLDQLVASARQSTSSLAESAWARMRIGETTLEELIRVLPYQAVTDFRQRYIEKTLPMES